MARVTKAQAAERAETIATLRGMVERGQTVYTKVEHVSRSGMSRNISAYIMEVDDNTGRAYPRNISGYVASALAWPRDDRSGAVKVGGCGMDMGFHLVYSLAQTLFRDDPEPTEDERAACPKWCGVDVHLQRHGYALKQEWL